MYHFAVLDPRPISAAEAANAAILGPKTFGIEVTIPILAAQCGLGNIDPQHSDRDTSLAAIEVALTVELPPDGTTIVTIRPDLDSVGAMAILALRKRGLLSGPFPTELSECGCWVPCPECQAGPIHLKGCSLGDEYERFWIGRRVQEIAAADKFARGDWPGPRPLPTENHMWGNDESMDLAAIAAAVADFKVPMTDRVSTMERWLLRGGSIAPYYEIVRKERYDMVCSFLQREIKVQTRTLTKPSTDFVVYPDIPEYHTQTVAIVESSHRAAMTIGYALAPVVVAFNPSFKLGAGEPHRKFTVAQYGPDYVDISAALAELNKLEAGWGGSPTIIGSPQGVSSQLTVDQVVAVVAKHISR